MASTFGADNIRKHINPSVFGQQTAIALGLDIKGLVYTDEEAKQIIDSEQAAVNAANFTKSASGPAIGGIMNMIANQQQPQTQT
jgi:hypothetical protein